MEIKITPFQREVAQAFFTLPAARGFVLSGGAALIATGVVDRYTEDLDFFAARGEGDVQQAKLEFLELCNTRGWKVEIIHDAGHFVRLAIDSGSDVLAIDLGLDATPLVEPTVTFIGPTLAVTENAGRKVLALFGRWLPRDFVDTFALSKLYSKAELLELAGERDAGFDNWHFAQALRYFGKRPVESFQVPDIKFEEMRSFFNEWAKELESDGPKWQE